jgi:hypothetical protein
MVWFVGVCLAAQRHNKGGHERYLGADSLGQGAESVVPSIVGKISSSKAKVWHDSRQAWGQVLEQMRAQDAVKWLVADDL